MKRQGRRTISVSRGLLDRATSYARENGNVPVSVLAEFALERQVAAPLDRAAFAAWNKARLDRVAVQQRAGGASGALARAQVIAARAAAMSAEQAAAESARAVARAAKIARSKRRAKLRATIGGRVILCTVCDQPGHNASRCPTIVTGPTLTGSPSEQAAQLAATEQLPLQVAADRRGVTRQAVDRAWLRLFGDAPRPGSVARAEARAAKKSRIAELIGGEGKTPAEAAAATGLSVSYVSVLAREAGVAPSIDRKRRLALAVKAVAAGASYAEAAADHDVGYATVAKRCRKRGLPSQAAPQLAGRGARRAVRAAELVVTKNMAVNAAARKERCAPASVSEAVARIRARAARSAEGAGTAGAES